MHHMKVSTDCVGGEGEGFRHYHEPSRLLRYRCGRNRLVEKYFSRSLGSLRFCWGYERRNSKVCFDLSLVLEFGIHGYSDISGILSGYFTALRFPRYMVW